MERQENDQIENSGVTFAKNSLDQQMYDKDLSQESKQKDHRHSLKRQHDFNYRQNCNDLPTVESLNVSDLGLYGSPYQATTLNTTHESSKPLSPQISELLKLKKKISAIDRVRNGEAKCAVARAMSTPESTLRGWCKTEEKLRAQLDDLIRKTSGNYNEGILAAFRSGNNDHHETGENTTTEVGSSGAARHVGEELALGSTPKRIKLNRRSIAATLNTSNCLTTADLSGDNYLQFFQWYHKRFLNVPAAMPCATLPRLAGCSTSDTNSPADYLHACMSNDAIASTSTANMTSTSNVLRNANRVRRVKSTIQCSSSGKENIQPSNAEEPICGTPRLMSRIPLPSSASSSRYVTATSSKSPKGSKLNAIISKLASNIDPTKSVCETEGETVFNSTRNDNNSNADRVNNENGNQSSPDSLPPRFSEAFSCCIMLLYWLETNGRSLCSSEQIEQVRAIRDIFISSSKKIKPTDRITRASLPTRLNE